MKMLFLKYNLWKSDYNFEIKEKKEIKIAIEGKEMNDVNLKFQPANINDIIFEEAFNQIFKRSNND